MSSLKSEFLVVPNLEGEHHLNGRT